MPFNILAAVGTAPAIQYYIAPFGRGNGKESLAISDP